MEKRDELYAGKAKSVFTTDDPERLVIVFRNDTSAFDGKKKEALDRKGAVNNQFNAAIMEMLHEAGIPTHFEKLLSANESLVKKLDMIPVECVVRNIAAGSIVRRLGVEEGKELNPPTFELFLKDDALGDPMINEYHVRSFHGEVVLGDEFSPDGCRLWDKDTREKMDKDRFRQDLGNVIEAYEEVGRRLGMTFQQ